MTPTELTISIITHLDHAQNLLTAGRLNRVVAAEASTAIEQAKQEIEKLYSAYHTSPLADSIGAFLDSVTLADDGHNVTIHTTVAAWEALFGSLSI